MKLKIPKFFPFLFCVFGCAESPIKTKIPPQPVEFKVKFSDLFPQINQVEISITVPNSVKKFVAPEQYGDAPVFTQYIKNIIASDSSGQSLKLQSNGAWIHVVPSDMPYYILTYTYEIPQKISGEISSSLPNLNKDYGRFDNNTLFLSPDGCDNLPAKLSIIPPEKWRVVTGWGEGYEFKVTSVSKLISGMIALGNFEYSKNIVGDLNVIFAIKGDYSHDVIKEQFSQVLKVQQEIAGPLSEKKLLAVFQPTVNESSKGTSLTNAFVVNIPTSTKLVPFNFQVMGTISHELFHQWNVRQIYPASEDGAYLFTEGFTNYFAVAALVRAKLMPPESFAWFLWHYRDLLEKNPKYRNANFESIQSGFKTGDSDLKDLAYTRGPFVAVLLDLAIRKDTHGRESLVSWFQELNEKFGGKNGYNMDDLKKLVIKISGKSNGEAVRVFEDSFLGSRSIDTFSLFKKLGISCDEKSKKCVLGKVDDPVTRQKLFSAVP